MRSPSSLRLFSRGFEKGSADSVKYGIEMAEGYEVGHGGL